MIPRTLVVTNDFPPRVGGVQQYVWNLVRNLPADRVAVLAPNWTGWREHDRDQPFPVERWPASFLWPTSDLARRVRSVARDHRAEVVLFGHGYPLPLLAPSVARAGLAPVVLTHGAEVWIARVPGLAASMARAWRAARAVTAVSRWTAAALQPLAGERPMVVLHPGVDETRFEPSIDGSGVRARLGLGERPVVLCVSRLVPRKGQDVLIRGLPIVRERVPAATLVIAGGGADRPRLERLAGAVEPGAVVFAGEVADRELPAFYAAADAFAMPCRSRWGGLEVEGFGIVFLEAAAAGKPVVAGRSGGAAEAVEDLRTGFLVEGAEPKAVALAVGRLLEHPEEARRMGTAGRARVQASFTWNGQAAKLADILRSAIG